jgi:hypothetical protein
VQKRESLKIVRRELPYREYLSAEDEESLLFKAVIRQRLVKTQQAGKDLLYCGD